jgi:5-methylcytosine-specific restriction endonuclease McrA
MEKLEKAKAILSHKYPKGIPFENLFEILLDEYLDKHNPKQKIQRRDKRKNKTKAKKRLQQNNKRTRQIPQSVQDKVYVRDGGRCTFIGSNGRRCNQTWDLEIDHVKPFARGGGNYLDNLRLLCAKHNQYEAERVYGKRFMEQQRCKATPMRK